MSVNINELLARAAALRDETALNSISPDRAGGIMYDTLLAMNELWLQQGSALVISKIYASVAAMEADSAPVSDLTGQPLRPGQIVVIASSDSDNGSVYRYDGTEDDTSSWSKVGAIGGVPVVDSLDSDSSTLPLAARQGKALKEDIDAIPVVDVSNDTLNIDGVAQGELAGQLEDNPEWVKVVLDSQNKILYGVKKDGKFYFGEDCPPQVARFVERAIDALGIDQILDILNGKVDKVSGKSLINSEFAASLSTVNNPEYLAVIVDSDGKIIEAIDNDGRRVSFIPSGSDANVCKTVFDAVLNKKTGIIQIGENVIVGLKTADISDNLAVINERYRSTLPSPLFPYVKKATLHRLYDDAATPNMLYVCSHSDKHIFYSICPTQAKHITYESFEQFNSNYFYYANKETPSDLVKVVLPTEVSGVNIARRIKYVFEMSNGDCLVEIENGQQYTATSGHNNIYKVRKVFSGETILESDITLSLAFDMTNTRLSAFDQIVEYSAGHIVLAPYGAGATAKVYITKDYGDNWDLIFCGDASNSTHFIKPKAERLGDAQAYGVWPTPEYLESDYPLDWSGTGNGNIHIHGIAYDRWYNRIWIATGDGAGHPFGVTGVWWTDDEGYTWKRIPKFSMGDSQFMGIIPMEHCVLFSTDGKGDGFFRWSRNGKDTIIEVEPCYNYLGHETALIVEAGRSIHTKSNFYLTSFGPDNVEQGDWAYKGGIVATFNGFDFTKIYEDSFSEGTFETAEIGWNCDIVDCGDKLVLSADKGGYIELSF